MRNGQVGGNLDLRGATLADLDLSGATVVGELQLGGAYKSTAWEGKNGEHGALDLRNAHVGYLADADDKEHLQLEGFAFDYLGGSEETRS